MDKRMHSDMECKSDLDFGSDSDLEGLDMDSDMDVDLVEDLDSELEIEDLERGQGFHAITSSDEFKANIQDFNYCDLIETSNVLTRVERALKNEEAHPNPTASRIQYLRQLQEEFQKKINYKLEDFLNIIEFHNTYDAFAPHI
jgi:hypothetical protein